MRDRPAQLRNTPDEFVLVIVRVVQERLDLLDRFGRGAVANNALAQRYRARICSVRWRRCV